MRALFNLADNLMLLVIWSLLLGGLFAMLRSFGFLTPAHGLFYAFATMVERVADALLRPLRRAVPLLNGVDITPVLAILALLFLRDLVSDWRLSLAYP